MPAGSRYHRQRDVDDQHPRAASHRPLFLSLSLSLSLTTLDANRRGSTRKRGVEKGVERAARQIASTRSVVRAFGSVTLLQDDDAVAAGCSRGKSNDERGSTRRKTNASALLDFPDSTGPPLLLPRAPLSPPPG